MAKRMATPQPLLVTPPETSVRQPNHSPQPAALAQSLQVHLQALTDEILLFACGDGAAIALAEDGELRCRAANGIAPPMGAPIDARSGLTGACLSSGTLLRCDDSEEDLRVDRQVCRALGIRAIVCVPIRAGEEVVGIFEVFSSQPNAFQKLDTAALHAKAQEIATCFAAEEALLRAAVGSVAELGTTGDLGPSWAPVPRPPRRLRLSSKQWQALLGTLVLALGLFLLLRALQISGRGAPAWIAPQAASAAPFPAAQPQPAADTQQPAPRHSRPRTRPLPAPGAQQPLVVASASLAGPARDSNRSESPPPLPPDALISGAAPNADALHDLVSSVSAAQPSLRKGLPVSTGVPQPVLLRRVEPLYPALAKQGGIEGTVVLEALVNPSGEVTGLRVESGNSLLAAAALRAVQQWRYRPSRLNGKPVEVPIRITLKFQLGK